MHMSALHMEATYVNAVKPQDRQPRGEAAGWPASGRFKYFLHTDVAERISGTMSPVVEIPRDNQRRVTRHQGLDTGTDRIDLLATRTTKQAEMYADTMQVRRPAGDCDLSVQQAALLNSVG